MKTSIAHLPPEKQQDLETIVNTIREKYSVEMIVLFGSYARGDWVEELCEDGFYYKYQSDFDIFLVTETEHLAAKIERDDQLWNYFNRFLDIKKEGICLYNSGRFELAEEKELSPKEYKHLAQEDFDYYLEKAIRLNKIFSFALNEKDCNGAAFLLHQITENLYSAFLLVLTRYKPSTHDLKKLGSRVASIEPEFLKVFPQGTEEERKRFELLRKAYVDARYKKNYEITAEELKWLAERVNILQEQTREICKKKIESFSG